MPIELEYLSVLPESCSIHGGQILKVSFRSREAGKDWSIYFGGERCIIQGHVVRNVGVSGNKSTFLHAFLCVAPPHRHGPCSVSVQFEDQDPMTTSSDVVLFTYINVNVEMWRRALAFGWRALPVSCWLFLNLALVVYTEGLAHEDGVVLIHHSGGARPLIFAVYVVLLPCVILLYAARSDETDRLLYNAHMLGLLRYHSSQNAPLIWSRRATKLFCSFQHGGHLTEFLANKPVVRVRVDRNDVEWQKAPSNTFLQHQMAKVRRLEDLVARLQGRIPNLPEPRQSPDGSAEHTQVLAEFASDSRRALERHLGVAEERLEEEGAEDILDERRRFGESAFEIKWPSALDEQRAMQKTELSHQFVQLKVHQCPEVGEEKGPSLIFYVDRDMVRWLMFRESPRAKGLRRFNFLVLLVVMGAVASCVRIVMHAVAFRSVRFNVESAIFIATACITVFSAVIAIPYYGAAVLTARGQVLPSHVANGVAELFKSHSLEECFQTLCHGAHELFMGNVSQEEYQRFSGISINDELLEEPGESQQDTPTFMSQYGRGDEGLDTDPVHRVRFAVTGKHISGPANAVVRYGVEAGEDIERVVPCWLKADGLKSRVVDALFSHRSVAGSGLNSLRRGHQGTVNCIATLTCSRFKRVYVLTCGAAGWIKVWDSDGHLMHDCRGHHSEVLAVATARDHFTSADMYGVVVWRLREREDGSVFVVALAETGEGGVSVAMAERDGRLYSLAVGLADVAGTLALIWRLPPSGFRDKTSLGGAKGMHVVARLQWHPQLDLTLLGCCALTCDEAAVAVGPTLQVWEFDGRERCTMEHELPVDSVVLHEHLALTVCGTSGDNAINVWDSQSGELLRRVSHEDVTSELSLADSGSGVVSLAVCGARGFLASGSADNSAVVWGLLPHPPFLQPKLVGLHPDDVQCLAFAEVTFSLCSPRDSTSATLLRREEYEASEPVLFSGAGAEINCWKLGSVERESADGVEMLHSPYVVLKSASMSQAVAPTALLVLNFFQFMAFPLSMHYPWNHRVRFLQVFCHLFLLDFEAFDLLFDKYYFWLYRFWAVSGILALCVVWAYSGAINVLLCREKLHLQELEQRKLWLTSVASGGECNFHETAERFEEAEANLKDAGIVKDPQRLEQRLLAWEEEWRTKSGLDRETVRRQLMRQDYASVSPAARAALRISLVNRGMDGVMLLFGSVLGVPITRLLVQSLDCTGRDTDAGEDIPMLDVAWVHDHEVRCDTALYRSMASVTIVLGLLWAPVMLGLIAANGKARSLLMDEKGKFHRFGFLSWSCFQAASARTTEMMPMGLFTRSTGRLKHDLGMALCRITFGVLSVCLGEEVHRKKQAAAFAITAAIMVLVVIIFRPFCHRAMHGFVISLYAAVFLANVLALDVVYINDPSAALPANLLFASFALSLAVGIAIGRCLGHVEQHKLKVHKPGTAWTPFCRRHEMSQDSAIPFPALPAGEDSDESSVRDQSMVSDQSREREQSRDLRRLTPRST